MRAKIVTPARPAIETREELERVAGEVSAMLLGRENIQNRMDAEILEVRERYEQVIASMGEEIKPLLADLQAWAEEHRLDTFQERKSLELVHATIGFRIGMPRLALRRGIKWALVLEFLKARLGGRFVRVKHEIDKDALLAERDALGKEKLASLGVEVVQDESFYVEPRREDRQPVAGTR